MDSSAFASDVRTTEQQVQASARRMGSSLKQHLSAGFGSAKTAFKGMASSLGGALKNAATFGGAIGIGVFVKDALDAEESAGKLSQMMRGLGDESANTAGTLAYLRDRSQQLQSRTTDLASALKILTGATGDVGFSKEALDSVATFQDVFRISAEGSAQLIQMLNKKAGASAEEIRTKYGPALYDAFNQGGLAAEDMVQYGDQVFAMMQGLGLRGSEGLMKLVGVLNLTDKAGGPVAQRVSGLKALFAKLESPAALKAIQKDMHGAKLKFADGEDAVERFRKTLQTKGGFEALDRYFKRSPETLAFWGALTEPFTAAKEAALAAGNVKPAEAQKAGVDALLGALDKVTTVKSTEATLERERAERLKESSKRMQLAIDRMAATFTKPEILDSIEKLAAQLPALADAFAKLMNVVVKHPALAAGGFVGAKLLGAGISGSVGSFFAQRAAGAAAATAAGSAATAAAGSTTAAAAMSSGAVYAGGAAIGAAAAVAFVAAVGAASAGLGYAIYKGYAEPAMKKEHEATTKATYEVSMEAESAMYSKDTKRQRAALAAIEEQKKKVKESKSAWNDAVGSVVAMFGGKSPEDQRRKAMAELEQQEARLRAKMEERERAEQRASRAVAETARSFERVNQANTARGVLPPPASAPGSSPAGG